MRSKVIKISSLWLIVLWLTMSMPGCGSSTRPPAAQVAQLALVANLDANSLSAFNVDTKSNQLASMGAMLTGVCMQPRYLELHPTNGLLYATCQGSNTAAMFSVNKRPRQAHADGHTSSNGNRAHHAGV